MIYPLSVFSRESFVQRCRLVLSRLQIDRKYYLGRKSKRESTNRLGEEVVIFLKGVPPDLEAVELRTNDVVSRLERHVGFAVVVACKGD